MPQSSRQKQNKELGTRITNIFPITLAETKKICDNNVRAWVSPVFSSTPQIFTPWGLGVGTLNF